MKNYIVLLVLVFSMSLPISAQEENPEKKATQPTKPPAVDETTEEVEASKPEKFKPKAERIDETDVFLTYSLESLTNDRGVWQEARMDFVHRFTNRQVLYGAYRETDRFRLRDREASLGIFQPINDDWTVNLEASASPTSRVLPKWSGMAGVERSFGDGWIGKASFRRTEREAAKVNATSFGVDKYWGKNLASYSFSLNNLEGTGTSPSQRARYSRFYNGDSSINVGFAFGDEVEQIDSNTVLKSSIKNVSLHGTHRFSPSFSLNYGLGFHRQGSIYDRRRVSIGLRLDF